MSRGNKSIRVSQLGKHLNVEGERTLFSKVCIIYTWWMQDLKKIINKKIETRDFLHFTR